MFKRKINENYIWIFMLIITQMLCHHAYVHNFRMLSRSLNMQPNLVHEFWDMRIET